MQVDIPTLTAENSARWQEMQASQIVVAQATRVVARLWTPTTKARYQTIATAAKVPAFFIALAHERESSGNWECSLAQGDPLSRRSIHVPAGRIPPPAEPPFTFEAAAIDALTVCDHVNQWTDWSIPGGLTSLERLNGLGYAERNWPSPYIWAGSNQYHSGKYVADGQFDPDAVDPQLGCAVMLACMLAADQDLRVQLGQPAGEPPAPPHEPAHDTSWIQAQMNLLGQHDPWRNSILAALAELHPPAAFPLRVDGDYGMATRQAVRGFQRAHGGLLDDGRAGPASQPMIEAAVAALT
jgi:lysozyme family protein